MAELRRNQKLGILYVEPAIGDQLDRPYGDQENDYLIVHFTPDSPISGEPTGDLVADEEAAAAAEAASIGGDPGGSDVDNSPDTHHWGFRKAAFEPVEQAGGGQAEGYEEAEALLMDHAGDPPPPETTADGFDLDYMDVDPDAEGDVEKELTDYTRDDEGAISQDRDLEDSRKASGETAEADETRSTEVTFDPGEDEDDPGRGPGLPWER